MANVSLLEGFLAGLAGLGKGLSGRKARREAEAQRAQAEAYQHSRDAIGDTLRRQQIQNEATRATAYGQQVDQNSPDVKSKFEAFKASLKAQGASEAQANRIALQNLVGQYRVQVANIGAGGRGAGAALTARTAQARSLRGKSMSDLARATSLMGKAGEPNVFDDPNLAAMIPRYKTLADSLLGTSQHYAAQADSVDASGGDTIPYDDTQDQPDATAPQPALGGAMSRPAPPSPLQMMTPTLGSALGGAAPDSSGAAGVPQIVYGGIFQNAQKLPLGKRKAYIRDQILKYRAQTGQ